MSISTSGTSPYAALVQSSRRVMKGPTRPRAVAASRMRHSPLSPGTATVRIKSCPYLDETGERRDEEEEQNANIFRMTSNVIPQEKS